MPHSVKKRLSEAIKDILNTESEFYILHKAIKELEAIFTGLSPIKGAAGKVQVTGEIRLESGMAIAPDFAATVLTDIMRTVKFLRGVNGAIECAFERFEQRPVHLLYAGCGPYATIVLPLLLYYNPKQLKITLIDIHRVCLDSAEKILRALGLWDFIAGSYCCDASTYNHPTDDPIHIVVSETMSQELRGEPQVPITMNLAPQMVDGGILVPEKVRISLQGVDSRREHMRIMGTLPEEEQDRVRLHLCDIFALDKNCRREDAQQNAEGVLCLPAATITLADRPAEYKHLMVFTDIRIFGNTVIKPYESSLTGPLNLRGQENVKTGQALAFTYQLNNNPRFIYE